MKKQTTIMLTEDTRNRIAVIREKYGITQNGVIQMALMQMLRNEGV